LLHAKEKHLKYADKPINTMCGAPNIKIKLSSEHSLEWKFRTRKSNVLSFDVNRKQRKDLKLLESSYRNQNVLVQKEE